jgi:hypothetical protein
MVQKRAVLPKMMMMMMMMICVADIDGNGAVTIVSQEFIFRTWFHK